jgi:LmbE family N-acetylglucosaminyl deacetylase
VERLQLPDGRFGREACLQLDIPFMAALWKAIRDFQPDYLFCPPPPADALAGIHVDHEAVSAAVRRVAYMINVPHAFTPEYPADETQSQPCKVPVILHVYDTYMSGTNRFDLAVDVESAFDLISKMSWCHQSQIREWLPWVGRHDMRPPEDLADWGHVLRRRFRRRNQEVDLDAKTTYEVFTVTAWGQVPKYEDIVRDFPVSKRFSHLSQLNAKLQKWKA